MQGTINISVEKEAETFAIEYALNLAHQGHKDSATLIFGFLGLDSRWHIDKLVYYFKEGNINKDNSEEEWLKRRSNK